MALQAIFVVRDRAGARRVAAQDLLGARGKLAADAIVTHVLWPRSGGQGGFYEVARRDGHAPVVGAMVTVSRETCRIGLCGVLAVGTACPTVARAVFSRFPTAPEPAEIDERLVADLGEIPRKPLAGDRCTDPFASAGYRREIAPVVIQRAVMAAARASTG
jgi:CO/xanthine dehydrogenase FAD-binding subunit